MGGSLGSDGFGQESQTGTRYSRLCGEEGLIELHALLGFYVLRRCNTACGEDVQGRVVLSYLTVCLEA